jgi:4-hydroxy-tetrahydrodipicolinate reductase
VIRIGLLGATGRMGQWVTRLLAGDYSEKAQPGPAIGRVQNENELEALLSSDVVIDFALPEAMLSLARVALQSQAARLPAFIVGSTGWKPEQTAILEKLAKKTPVLVSSNFSMGVLALQQILENASPLLAKLGYEPVLVETHHRHKKDAPSGTALLLSRTIEAATDDADSNVQTHSIRAGEVIGDHEITFYGPGDHLVLGHFAQDRSIFARGAIDAALWLASSRPSTGKILTMHDYFSETLLQ